MAIVDLNRLAVGVLLADADRVFGLPEVEDVRGNREIVRSTATTLHKYYIDLLRRAGPLIMSDGDQATFQKTLNCLRARLRSFGENIAPPR